MKIWHAALLVALFMLLAACSRSNSVLLGRVERTIAGHRVVVTDCYRTKVDPPDIRSDSDWSFAPCRDAKIVVRANAITINGTSYGTLAPGDGVLVDHGVVSIGRTLV